MDCQELQQDMFALIDKELPVKRECACRLHVSICKKCRNILARETKLEELIVRSCREIAPKGFKERLLATLKKAQALAKGSSTRPLLDEGLM